MFYKFPHTGFKHYSRISSNTLHSEVLWKWSILKFYTENNYNTLKGKILFPNQHEFLMIYRDYVYFQLFGFLNLTVIISNKAILNKELKFYNHKLTWNSLGLLFSMMKLFCCWSYKKVLKPPNSQVYRGIGTYFFMQAL